MFCACVWINLWSLTVVLCNNANFDVNCYLVNNWPHSIEGFPVLCIWQSKTWYAWHRSDPSSHLCPVSQSAVWISHNLEGHIALKQSGKLSQKFPQFLNLLFNTERKRSKGLLLKSFFFFLLTQALRWTLKNCLGAVFWLTVFKNLNGHIIVFKELDVFRKFCDVFINSAIIVFCFLICFFSRRRNKRC